MTEPAEQPRRARSEYVLDLAAAPVGANAAPVTPATARLVGDGDRSALAELILDAYRGTIDDEGETLADAFDAIDEYLAIIDRAHSFVVADPTDPHRLVGMSFVLAVDGRHYIDPVAVAASAKGQGLGRALVSVSLRSLVAAGAREVGATITDGNTASERLFTGLAFRRVGSWPR